MDLYSEFFSVIGELKRRSIKYAVVGGIAMAYHDNPRFTRDIDILALPEDIDKIREMFSDLDYLESSEPWTFQKTKLILHRFVKMKGEDHVMFDVLIGEDKRHRKIIEQAVTADSHKGPINIASKEDLIWMKSIRDSDQDRVDINNLKNDKD